MWSDSLCSAGFPNTCRKIAFVRSTECLGALTPPLLEPYTVVVRWPSRESWFDLPGGSHERIHVMAEPDRSLEHYVLRGGEAGTQRSLAAAKTALDSLAKAVVMLSTHLAELDQGRAPCAGTGGRRQTPVLSRSLGGVKRKTPPRVKFPPVAAFLFAGTFAPGPRAMAIDSNIALLELQPFTHRASEHRASKQSAWLGPR